MNIRHIHYVILGFINEEPTHGYQIYKYLTDMQGIGLVWKINMTNIYGLMDALERNELIHEIKQEHIEKEYPPKKYFAITSKGEEQFLLWLKKPVNHGREIRQVFLSKIYFAEKQGKEIYQKLIDDQIEECEKWRINITQLPEDNERFSQIVRSYRTTQIESTIAWLKSWKTK